MGGARRQARAWAYVYTHPSSSSPLRRRRTPSHAEYIHILRCNSYHPLFRLAGVGSAPSLPPSPMKTNREKKTRTEGRKDGRTDDGHPSYLVSVPPETETAAAAASQSAVPLPSFLPLPLFLVPPSSLPYISLSRYAISPYSHSGMFHRRTPSLSRLPPSLLLPIPSSTPMPSHGSIAQQDTDCKRGRTKSNSISFSAVSRNRATKCPASRKAS